MAQQFDHYCHNCGGRGDGRNRACEACGTVRALNRQGLIAKSAFVLNELRAWPLADILNAQQRARAETYYEDQLLTLTRPAAAVAAAVAVPATPFVPARPVAPVAAAAPLRPRPAPAPRKEMDWSWLTEQQANLFLFAGAFLTVVAALIYVGYSGQAVSGALKMTLLAGYTAAFIAAGTLCLRVPRVEMAGRVFFAIGAILVPINFVAARTLAEDSDLNPETLWLTGSIVTAAFWTAVAYLGLGRAYAFGGGIALLSAVLAFVVRVEMPPEWIPLCFIALATAMSLTSIVANTQTRSRIGEIWVWQGHAVAALSAVFALGIAILVSDGDLEFDLATRWFLPLSFGALAAYALLQMAATREQAAAVAAIAAFGAAFVATAYAIDAPAEAYVVVLAVLAVAFGGLMLAARNAPTEARLARETDVMLRWAAMISTGIALGLALLVLQLATEQEAAYTVRTRWFLPATFALVAVFYAIDAFVRRERSGAIALLASLTAIAVATVYALDVSAEYYAFGLLFPAVAIAVIARWAKHSVLERLDAAWREDAFMLGYGAAGAGVAIAVVAAIAGAAEDSGFEPAFRAYLAIAFVAAAAFAAIDASRKSRIGGVTLAGAIVGIGGGVAYAIDPSAELYAFGLLVPAILLGITSLLARERETAWLPAEWRADAAAVGWAAVAGGLAVALGALAVSEDRTTNPYEPVTKWFLAASFTAAAIFFALDALHKSRPGAVAFVASLPAIGASVAYAVQASGEMYAFGLLLPPTMIAAAARFVPERYATRSAQEWREDAFVVGRISVSIGLGVAIGALAIAVDTTSTYEPTTRWFLPLAFAASAAFLAIDASRGKRAELSAALLASIGTAILSVPYALDAPAEYYGVALAATGALFAVGGRAWTPAWIDERVRDALAAVTVTASWVLFEGAYVDAPRIGAAVHFAAVAFYLGAAFTDRSKTTLRNLLDIPQAANVRVASGWLYAAGLTAVIGYIDILRSMPGSDDTEGGTIAGSLMFAAIAFGIAGAIAKQLRPEFRVHLYVMALAVALVSLASGGTAGTITVVLGVYVAMFIAIATYEDEPLLGAPAVLFGFAAVGTWREYADAGWWTIPAAYSMIGLVLGVAALLLEDRKRWLTALGSMAALFVALAPVLGVGLLVAQADDAGRINGTMFYETALYQASTISMAVLGVAAFGAAVALGRHWIIVPSTAVLTVALLMQIGSFNPENAQAYTAVIGAYLVLLGAFGLSKYRLIPDLEELASWVEGLGAAIIMFPSFVQSIDAGWRYQWILLLEASLFFAAGVGLRRRGLLAVSLVALVLVAGRALFDAVNALPNWVVVMVAGVALLGVGMGILLGRDRWSEWQRAIVGWWEETGNGHATP